MFFLFRKPHWLALLILITLIAWIVLRQITTQHSPPALQSTTAEPMQVQFQIRQAQALTREIILNGRTATKRHARIATEISGQITKILVNYGEQVKQGDLVMRLSVADRRAQLREAEALVDQYQTEYQAKQDLSSRGFQAKTQIAAAKALLEQAKTRVIQAKLALQRTEIRAPFAGVIRQRLVEIGDVVGPGDVVAELVAQDPLLITAEVTEQERTQLQIGQMVNATLINQQQAAGQLSFIDVESDSNTRMFDIEAAIPNPDGQLAAGMTAQLRIPTQTVQAHQIPASLLSLNDAGVLGIKALDEDDRVTFHPAQFVKSRAEAVWLQGLPENLRLITVGQGFVMVGELVEAIAASNGAN